MTSSSSSLEPAAPPEPTVRLTPLGGVGRFGKNCLLVQGDDGSVLVDCGVRFAGPELPGFDAGLPDLERLASVTDLRAVIVTHGHEDHIGALPFLLRERPSLPLVSTRYTAQFIERRCKRYDVTPNITELPFGAVAKLAGFDVTFAAVSHSIPGSASLMLGTSVGTIVHSGDFRVDEAPVLGPPTDTATLAAAAGDAGVRCLLADSTGALTDDTGDALTGTRAGIERSVLPKLLRCFDDDDGERFGGMVIVGLFASHLQRLALLAEACRQKGRKLVLLGAGLHDVYAIANAHRGADDFHDETGASSFADVVISEAHAHSLPRERLCLAVTGTQGEP